MSKSITGRSTDLKNCQGLLKSIPMNGTNGTNGTNGSQGIQGVQGLTGVPGPQGSSGLAGPQGNQGPTGSQGSQGISGNSGVDAQAGRHASLWHDESRVTVGAPLAYYTFVGDPYPASYQNVAAQNDSFAQTFELRSGTYNFNVLAVSSNIFGIITWSVDGTVIGTMDFYTNSGTPSTTQSFVVTIVTGTSHLLEGKILTKNTSSGGYQATLVKYWFN